MPPVRDSVRVLPIVRASFSVNVPVAFTVIGKSSVLLFDVRDGDVPLKVVGLTPAVIVWPEAITAVPKIVRVEFASVPLCPVRVTFLTAPLIEIVSLPVDTTRSTA